MSESAAPATAAPAAPNAAGTATSRRRRWRRRLLAACVLIGLLVVFHAPLLRWLAGGLVVDEPLEPAEALVWLGGDLRFDEVAALYRDGFARQVVLFDDRSPRVVRLGIVESEAVVTRRELTARGVPEEALTTLTLTAPGEWEAARGLRGWLRDHPDARATVLCGQLGSRRAARVFREILAPEEAGRLRWRAVPDRRFAVGNWWHERQGVTTVAGEYVSLGFVVLKGEDREPPPPWDPYQYEKALRDGR